MATTQGGDWLGLAGKVAVVTGAAGGMGRAIAAGFAAAGAAVALLDRDAAGCESLAAELAGTGARTVAVGCDAMEEASIADGGGGGRRAARAGRHPGEQRRHPAAGAARLARPRGVERAAVGEPHRLPALRPGLRARR